VELSRGEAVGTEERSEKEESETVGLKTIVTCGPHTSAGAMRMANLTNVNVDPTC
jgi:hypothetical protein